MGRGVPILDPGVVQGQVLRGSREPGLVCHEVFYPGRTLLETHGHENAFFALSLDGCYNESACGERFDCFPRSVVFHPPGEEHAISIAAGFVRCFVLEIGVAEVARRYDAVVPPALFHADGGSLSALMARMYAEFRLADASSSLAMQGLLLQILALATRGDSGNGEHESPPWLERIDRMLRERFRSRLTLEEIAGAVGISPARVSAIFRRVRHRSLGEEQRRLRIEFACGRLQERDATLADVAVECGFSDQPHFTRAFKDTMGMTPAQYRALFL